MVESGVKHHEINKQSYKAERYWVQLDLL